MSNPGDFGIGVLFIIMVGLGVLIGCGAIKGRSGMIISGWVNVCTGTGVLTGIALNLTYGLLITFVLTRLEKVR